MIVETKVVGERAALDDIELAAPTGPTTLRALIEVLVASELNTYDERRRDRRVLRMLTPADLARGVESGRYGAEARATPPAPSPDVAVARAVEAFGDGLYFAFLDGTQVEDLDATLMLDVDSRLRLVRLVALAGG